MYLKADKRKQAVESIASAARKRIYAHRLIDESEKEFQRGQALLDEWEAEEKQKKKAGGLVG